MYLRFTAVAGRPARGIPAGLFQLAYRLEEEGALAAHEAEWLREVVGWFEKHLHAPRLESPGWKSGARGLLGASRPSPVRFWFKQEAREHVQRMQQVAVMLRHHDIGVRIVRSARPGRIVYEDEWQVGVVPFRDSPR